MVMQRMKVNLEKEGIWPHHLPKRSSPTTVADNFIGSPSKKIKSN
jgi:hypothetical protein